MKHRFFMACYFTMAILAVACFQCMASQPITFTMLSQEPAATMEKYADVWEDRRITTTVRSKVAYENGEIVGHITIPQMGFYEMPIYYGADTDNTDWQITTAGHLGEWDMFGENGRAVVGAHNYQLFASLPILEAGDCFLIETPQDIFIYEVVGTTIYHHEKDDWNQVAYADAALYSVNLMTCYPITQSTETTGDMYIVYTKMVRGTKYK